MGYHEAMDIRGIAWAGYFFDPLSCPDPVIIIEGPTMTGEVIGETAIGAIVLRPGLGGEDLSIKPPHLKASESIPAVDPDELKPDMRTE